MRLSLPQILIALVGVAVASGTIALLGYDIGTVFLELFKGAFGTSYYTSESVLRATPLILSALAFTLAFRSGYWNIGAEGQIWMGGVFAAGVGIFVSLPFPLHAALAALMAFVGGALWGLIPGILRAKLNVNEILTTLMLNYVAFWIAYYIIYWPWDDPATFVPETYPIKATAVFPRFVPELRVHTFLIVGLLCAVALYMYFEHTKPGYEMLALGSSPKAARIGGVNMSRTIILASLLSGGIAGLAGSSEVLGLLYYLDAAKLAGLGYLGIGVSMLGYANPFGVIFSGIFVGGILTGADNLQRTLGLKVSDAAVNFFVGITIMGCLLTPLILRLLRKSKILGWERVSV